MLDDLKKLVAEHERNPIFDHLTVHSYPSKCTVSLTLANSGIDTYPLLRLE